MVGLPNCRSVIIRGMILCTATPLLATRGKTQGIKKEQQVSLSLLLVLR